MNGVPISLVDGRLQRGERVRAALLVHDGVGLLHERARVHGVEGDVHVGVGGEGDGARAAVVEGQPEVIIVLRTFGVVLQLFIN